MSQSASQIQNCFNQLADTSKLKLFEAPDVTLDQKRQSTATIETVARKCANNLQQYNTQAQQLQSLYLSGYTSHYRSAHVIKEHALDIAGQSNDALAQYQQLASFLDDYFKQLTPFVAYTDDLSNLVDTNVLYGSIKQLNSQGNDLHARATAIRNLKPATGFEGIIQPTALMLDNAADGFDNLALGYSLGSDPIITNGFHSIEKATADYDSNVKNLPFASLQNSYIIKQVNGLPVKYNDLKSNVAY
jgi:hypothetical protein